MIALTRAVLMEMGHRFAPDPAYFLSVREHCGEMVLAGGTAGALPGAASYFVSWTAEWARLAFPVIQPSHQYCAALMATVPPADLEIRPPWPTFYLAIPDQLVSFLDREGRPEPCTGVLVFVQKGHWNWIAVAGSVEFSRICYTIDDMRESPKDVPHAWDFAQLKSDDHDERAALVLSRLLLNVCLAMSDPQAVRQVGKAHRWRTGEPLPQTPRTFELNRPVRIDCREQVRQFVSGGSRLAAVQWLVRGHWRNQAHGPEHSLRRPQWIEPFWKGSCDAPLNVRQHTLK